MGEQARGGVLGMRGAKGGEQAIGGVVRKGRFGGRDMTLACKGTSPLYVRDTSLIW